MLEDERAVEPLIKLLKDKKPKVRISAIKALEVIEDERAVSPIIMCLEDGEKEVKIEALNALAVFAGKEVISALKKKTSDPEIGERVKEVLEVINSQNDEN